MTAVFAIVSFVLAHTGGGVLNPHHIIRGWIDGSALLFVLAGILGLLINIPVPYGDPDPSDLDILILPQDASAPPFLADTANVAAYKIAATRINLVRKARRWNSLKAQLLFWAVVSEVVAIAFLAWGIHKLLI